MRTRLTTCLLLLITTVSLRAQCTVGFPVDTTTLYWGYDPLACTTLTPVVTGAQPTQLVWNNGNTSPSLTVCDTLSTWYHVTLTDDTACTATDSVFVQVVDVRCGNNLQKVAVCHIPPGNPANAHTICISANGVPAHLAHGCQLGACAVEADSTASGMRMTVTPNPMGQESNVTIQSNTDQRVRVRAMDPMGRVLFTLLDAGVTAASPQTLLMERMNIPPGLSMVWIVADGDAERVVAPVMLVR